MSDTSFATRLKIYLEFAQSRPELFVNPPGGMRIVLDPAEIAAVEHAVGRDLEARGLPSEGANVGILLRDPWFYAIRDAVEFPDGARRMHARIINRYDNGAAILPLLDGRIVLVRHFRHPLRRAILEIPRGAIEPGCSPEDTARAEIHEEIGGIVRRVEAMGFLYGNSNLYGSGAHLFFAELESVGAPQIGEGIIAIERYTVKEFEDLMLRGEILDSFTVGAYAHARLRGFI
jgi:ADP-ribose pyrophosphatase